uniref:EF-hand domain-containing protein n=1 Tax=Urocitellus parryii TaxID=9999 RepID=A0A8D2ICP2_UROPR
WAGIGVPAYITVLLPRSRVHLDERRDLDRRHHLVPDLRTGSAAKTEVNAARARKTVGRQPSRAHAPERERRPLPVGRGRAPSPAGDVTGRARAQGKAARDQEGKASRKTKKKEGGALRAQRASSNVFSNFEQTQIQEFKEAFTLMDQNRDGFIDKEDLKDTYASLGKTNVKDDELDAMLREASGPINFTMFLNLFGEKLTSTDTEETILNAFKMLDPDGKGSIHKEYIKRLLMSQADKMTATEVDQMLEFASIDAAGNLDYKALSYVLTHGEEKEE